MVPECRGRKPSSAPILVGREAISSERLEDLGVNKIVLGKRQVWSRCV